MDNIYILLCDVLTNKNRRKLCNDEVKSLYYIAIKHGIWPILYLNLKQLFQDGLAEVPPKQMEIWENEYFFNVIQNIKMNSFVHKTIKALEKKGIPCCILKGETLAQLYSVPEARISGDTDIFIGTEKIDEAVETVKEMGYEVELKQALSHHIVCHSPLGGTIELHLTLHEEFIEEIWFDNQVFFQEPFQSIELENEKFQTLGYTDGAIFNTLHLIKHFLSNGVGLRQVFDVLLYLKEYKSEIDWLRYNQLMQGLKYDKFINVLYHIGVRYLNFISEDFDLYAVENEIVEYTMNEIMEAGTFGLEDQKRKEFYKTYTRERFHSFHSSDYSKYIEKTLIGKKSKIIFLSRERISIRYPYVKKRVLLLPIAWIHRLFDFAICLLKGKKKLEDYKTFENKNEQSDFVQKKMSLIRELDMI